MAKEKKKDGFDWLKFFENASKAIPYVGNVASGVIKASTKRPKPGEDPSFMQKAVGYEREDKLERVPLSKEEQSLKSMATQQLLHYLPLAMQYLQQPSQLEQAILPGLVGKAIPQLLQFGMNNAYDGPSANDPYGLGAQPQSFGGGLDQLVGGLMPLLQSYFGGQGGGQQQNQMFQQGQMPPMGQNMMPAPLSTEDKLRAFIGKYGEKFPNRNGRRS